MNLSSSIAIVTGASSGLGYAFSKALVNKGTTVFGLARNADQLETVHGELGELFHPVIVDISDFEKIENWVKNTFKGPLVPDILINNAGIGIFGAVDELSLDEWHTMINTNLSGVFYLTRLIVPYFKSKETISHIVNIASIAGLIGNPELSGYNASKFGLRGFSEALMKELRYDGIKVTCFYPGSVATHFFSHTKSDATKTHTNMMDPADIAKLLLHVLETPDNFLIDEIVMRPLNPRPPDQLK